MRNRIRKIDKHEADISQTSCKVDNELYSSSSPRKLFEDIYRKSIELGLEPVDFKYLSGLENIRKSVRRTYCLGHVCKIIFVVIFLVLFIFITEWPVSNTHFLVWWFQWYNKDPFKEPCIAYVPERVKESINPPLNCDFCKNVHQVDRVQNISVEKFESEYAYSGRPVVITDGTRNWTALTVFSYSFLKDIFSPGSIALEKVEKNCQFFPYRTEFSSLRKVFEMSEERASMKGNAMPWYIGWSNCDHSAANELRKHYTRPYFLPELSESSKTDWIFMGSPGYGAHLHIDHVDLPSWQAQITGRKRWVLEPPHDCYFQCTNHLEVVVNEGEIIVLDTNRWYHSTLNVGETISITIGSEYD